MLPLACTLGPNDGATRMRRWQDLSAQGRPTTRRSGHLLEVRYHAGRGIREELEALAAAERECCAFVTWTVGQEEGHVVLRVEANPARPDDVAPIAALFGTD
jgi:MerR family copper efflux transcriptional regulator